MSLTRRFSVPVARCRTAVLITLLAIGGCSDPEPAIDLTALSVSELARQLASGEVGAAAVTDAYLKNIRALDAEGPALNAMLELNPDARADAAALDEVLARSRPVGALHGVPVVIKGNIDVAGMTTSVGSLALADNAADRDAHLVAALRRAGAVILGTSNLSEWANFRDSNSSSGWSSMVGQTHNPHVLDRNPCGSSSGSAVAVAARLAPLAVGTETNGSIVCPAGVNGIVGIKPTVGLVSRSGIVPISHTQDTAGPMARSVTGAALLLEALMDHDPADPGAQPEIARSLVPDPQVTHLQGRRIGILRSYRGSGERPRVEAVYQAAIERLEVLGAELIDPIEYLPTPAMRGASYRVLLREFKVGLNNYLSAHQLPDGRGSLAEIIAYNRNHAESIMPLFGQSIFEESEATNGLDDPHYIADRKLAQDDLRADVKALFAEHRLDALFLPATGPAWKTDWVNGDSSNFGGTAYLAAITGYPSIVLPAGSIDSLPIGVGFVGLALSEAELIQMAYALEQSLPAPPVPRFIPTLED